jgi:hypothetical protein
LTTRDTLRKASKLLSKLNESVRIQIWLRGTLFLLWVSMFDSGWLASLASNLHCSKIQQQSHSPTLFALSKTWSPSVGRSVLSGSIHSYIDAHSFSLLLYLVYVILIITYAVQFHGEMCLLLHWKSFFFFSFHFLGILLLKKFGV